MWWLNFGIDADNAPLKKKIDELSPYMEKAGKKVAEKFNLSFAGGATAAVAVAGAILSRGFADAMQEAVKNVQAAGKYSLPIEEFAQLNALAETTGESVETYVKALKLGGKAAAEIRKQMAGAIPGGGMSERTQGNLAFLSGVMSDAWNGPGKELTGGIIGAISNTLFAGKGLWKFGGALLSGKGLGAAQDALAEQLAIGSTIADRELTRRKGEALLAKRAAADVKEDEEAKKAAEREKNRKMGADEFAYLKPGLMTADALSQVGIGTIASDRERRAFEQAAEDYLRRIAENTAGDLAAGGVEP